MRSVGGRAGEANEFSCRTLVQVSRLVDRGILASLPDPAGRLGHPGHLLFEFAVGRTARGAGGRFCGVHDLGVLAIAPAANARDCDRVVSGGGRVVDIDPPLA